MLAHKKMRLLMTWYVPLAALLVSWGPMPAGVTSVHAGETWERLASEFRQPPLERKSRPLWFWNGRPTPEETVRQMEKLREMGYAGVAVLPGGGKGNRGPGYPFMSREYLEQYKVAADTAKRLGMKMCLYDEYWFPSGYAGGLLAKQHPEALNKRLDRTVWSAKGPGRFEEQFKLPDGARLMGVVAVHAGDKRRVDVSDRLSDGLFRWDVPEGQWRIQAFVCVPEGARGMVDYLEPESVRKFYELTYEAYRRAMPEHFGTTIDSAFYDEPTFHWITGGRAWTPRFNEYFQKRLGFSPVTLYPALWEDIGPDTAAARNALFGFRATLFSEGFVRTIAERLAEHGVPLTGHVDQEEIVNPVGLCGDLMKTFQYQPIPGLDQIFEYGRGSMMYRIVSSAAYNYDRPLVMTEVYGGEGRIPIDMLYREAMDQAAAGVNLFVPHAVWYDASPEQVNFQPELSHRDPLYGKALPAYNQYIGRIHSLMQAKGRHVADVAVLYPIASLQAAYHFDGPLTPYTGGVAPQEADYMDLGQRLALDLHRDYTFLHPDLLREKCRVETDRIVLDNRVNRECFAVFVLPGMRAVRVETLRKLADFCRRGGKIVATTRLPDQAAEPGGNEEVRKLIHEIFGPEAYRKRAPADFTVTASSSWAKGGYPPEAACDGDRGTRWNAADQSGGDQWLAVRFPQPKSVRQVRVCEAFDRVTKYRIQVLEEGKWVDAAGGTALGEDATIDLGTVTTPGVRLHVDSLKSDSVSIFEMSLLGPKGESLLKTEPRVLAESSHPSGGRAWFLSHADPTLLADVLRRAQRVFDVEFDPEPNTRGVTGNFTYLHRVLEGRDVWFFANSSDRPIETTVRLRGRFGDLQWWDPHNGVTGEAAARQALDGDAKVTHVELRLPPVRSTFLVGRESPR